MEKKSLWSLAVILLILVWMPCYTVFGTISNQQPDLDQLDKAQSENAQGVSNRRGAANVESEQGRQVPDNSDEADPDSDVSGQSDQPLGESTQETPEKAMAAPDSNRIRIDPLEKRKLDSFEGESAKALLSLQYDEENNTWTELTEERKYLSGDFVSPLDSSELSHLRSAGKAKVVLTVYYNRADRTWGEIEEDPSERQYLPSDFKGLKTDKKNPVIVGIIILIAVSVISLGINCFLIFKISQRGR